MDPQTIPQQNISLSGISGGGEIDIYTYFTASPYFAGFVSHSSPEMKAFLTLFKTLPNPVREFLTSDTTASLIFSTGLQNDLNDEQIFTLAKSIRELVTGNLFIKDFPITVSSRLGIDDMKASKVVNTIISRSFSPIIEDVKRIQRNKFPEKIQQLQKEGGPEKITQSGAKPAPQVGPTEAQKLNQPAKPPAQPPAPQPIQSSAQPAPRPGLKPQAQPSQPLRPPAPLQQAPKPEPTPAPLPSLEPKFPNISQTPRPVNPPAQRPQFKIPDLGSFDKAQNKQPETRKETSPKLDIQKSFEDELQKVASVIDLREKSE